MRLVPRSLRMRVTVVFTAGAALALALCLTGLYVTLDRQLAAGLDQDLVTRSRDLAAAVVGGRVGVVATDPLAQLYAADGSVLVGSPFLGQHRVLTADEVRRLDRDVLTTRTLPLGRAGAPTAVRVFSHRVDSTRVLSVGVSAQPLQQARKRLLALLLLAGPLLLVVLAAAGWLLLRAVLRPVDMLTREAAALSSLEADRSLPLVPGDDEIARLARTLDAMLARLRVAFARERGFVDDASHELRTPIAVLRGEIELAPVRDGRANRARTLAARRARRGRAAVPASRGSPAASPRTSRVARRPPRARRSARPGCRRGTSPGKSSGPPHRRVR